MRKWPFVCLSMLSVFSTYAEYFPKQIIGVGDRLSDQGNTFSNVAINGGVKFVPITEGATCPLILPYELGAERIKPFYHGGPNYAVAGALT